MGSITATVMRADEDQRLRTKAQEGLRLTSYQDTQNPPHWAIGYGHDQSNPRPVRGLVNGEFYQGPTCAGLTITKAEADRLFDADIDEVERGISKVVTVELTQGQMNSCVDFCFHYGLEHFRQSTLLQKINFNPNNLDAILPQFARWNINAGCRDKAIYMRSCRRACVYAGVTIPQKLWEPTRFPWAVTDADQIDTSITPTVFELVEMGRTNVLPYKFDPSKPLPKPGAQETPPAPLPDSANDILVLDQPARPVAADSKGVETPEIPAPSVVIVESGAGKEASQPTTVLVEPPVVASPTNLPTTVAIKPPSKNSVPITEVPYKVDPTFGLKPMEETERWQASLAQNGGAAAMRAARYGWFGATPASIATFIEKDPIFSVLFMAALGLSAVWVYGYVRKSFGDWQRHNAEKKASQGMF